MPSSSFSFFKEADRNLNYQKCEIRLLDFSFPIRECVFCFFFPKLLPIQFFAVKADVDRQARNERRARQRIYISDRDNLNFNSSFGEKKKTLLTVEKRKKSESRNLISTLPQTFIKISSLVSVFAFCNRSFSCFSTKELINLCSFFDVEIVSYFDRLH